MQHEFEKYSGPEDSDNDWTFQNGDDQICIHLNMSYHYDESCKMMRCKHCGLTYSKVNEQPKFETCEEVYVDEVMGS